jgi:hypothetical protein
LKRQNKVGNRRNNADLEKKHKGSVPLGELKDISWLKEKERRFQKFQLGEEETGSTAVRDRFEERSSRKRARRRRGPTASNGSSV